MCKRFLPLLGVVLVALMVSEASAATTKAATFSIPTERASGQKNAPIVIEVFTDFQCPHCSEFYLQTLTRVMEDYCSKGKVYLIHREFPLHQFHYSREAARWALACAGIGQYDLAAAALFRDQMIWGRSGNIEPTIASVLTPAELKKVKQEMTDSKQKIDSALERDIFAGNTFQIHGTPSFRILVHGSEVYASHGDPGTSFPSYVILKRFLDEKLAK
jgi:protein-disulfide isomerase